MYSNWNYQNVWGKICRIEKNPIIISPYSMFEVNKLGHDDFFKFLISTRFSILYALLLQKHIQSHIPNNYQVINENKTSCNTLCPCISSVGEQFSRILHNIHFDHVIWHHNVFCNIFVYEKCHSGCVMTFLGQFKHDSKKS